MSARRRPMTGLVRLAALAFVACLAAAAPAWSAENIVVRAGQHDGFGRIVFDLPKPLGHTASVEGDRLTVTFDAPVTADVSRVARVIDDHVRTIRMEGDRRIVAELTGAHALKEFRNGNSVVVDLRPTNPGAANTVGTRFGLHPTFSRMVFDWTNNVGYRVREGAGGEVSIRFDRAANIAIDPRRVRAMRGFERATARPDSGATEVELRVDGRIRHFRDGFKVVVDVFHDRPVAKKPEPARAQPDRTQPDRAEVPAPTLRAKPAAPTSLTPPAAAPKPPPQSAKAPAAAPAQAPAPAPSAPEPVAAPARENLPAEPAPETANAPEPEPETAPETAAEVSEVAPPAHRPGPVDLVPPEMRARPENPATLPEEAAPLNIGIVSELDGVLLRFPFAGQTGTAVFRRGGWLWVVFDRLHRIDTDRIRAEGEAFLRDVEQVPHATATVLRMTTIPGYNALTARDATTWEIVLAPQLLKPEQALPVTTSAGSVPSVTVGPTLPAAPLKIVDPEVGDEIRVVPIFEAGDGVAQRHLYPDFRLLASIQGVALVPLSDRVEVRSGNDRVIVSASGGLRLTDTLARDRVMASGGSGALQRMYRFAEWRHAELGDYPDAHHELLVRLENADASARNNARLDLARFYLAHGLADRTLGILELAAGEDPALARVPAYKAVRGAARLLLGDTAGAEKDLFDRELDAEPEIGLWRAAVRGAQGEIVATSFELQSAERYVQDYPDALRIHFAFLGAEIAIASGDSVGAEFWLEVIGDAELTPAQIDRRRVFEGDIASRNGEIDTAVALYDRTIKGRDRLSRALATLSKVDLLISEEDMTPAEAVDELDRLRYVWRGDGLEFRILRRLGELEIEAGRYRDGLQTLKRAASTFPEHPAAPRMADDMRNVFNRLYLDGDADEMEPVTAIALFNEFRELAPAGAKGDAMIRRLAERLVAVDLLEPAAELLAHQVEHRLEGQEKAEVGARLAMIRMLDRKPAEALRALEASAVSNVPVEILEERAVVRARAHAQLGAFDKALAAVSNLYGEEVDLLRAEIFWKSAEWRRASTMFARLAGPIPADGESYSERDARHVLNSAVALALGGETERLETLGRTYGPAMAGTPFAADFRAMTSVDTLPRDFAEVMERVAQVDDFQAFMDSYRARLAAPDPSAS